MASQCHFHFSYLGLRVCSNPSHAVCMRHNSLRLATLDVSSQTYINICTLLFKSILFKKNKQTAFIWTVFCFYKKCENVAFLTRLQIKMQQDTLQHCMTLRFCVYSSSVVQESRTCCFLTSRMNCVIQRKGQSTTRYLVRQKVSFNSFIIYFVYLTPLLCRHIC